MKVTCIRQEKYKGLLFSDKNLCHFLKEVSYAYCMSQSKQLVPGKGIKTSPSSSPCFSFICHSSFLLLFHLNWMKFLIFLIHGQRISNGWKCFPCMNSLSWCHDITWIFQITWCVVSKCFLKNGLESTKILPDIWKQLGYVDQERVLPWAA